MDSTFDAVRAADARKRDAGPTVTAVLDGTEALLRDLALHEVSVDRIVEASGISRATFYRHFTSKDAVVAALFARVMDEVYDAFTGIADLEGALASGWAVWDTHEAVNRAVSENAHRVPELQALWTAIFDRFTDAIATQIDAERAAGRAPAGTDSRRLAAMLLYSTERLRYVAGRGDAAAIGTTDELFPALVDLWRSAIYT